MSSSPRSNIIIATRGSALALVQANMVLNQCRTEFPDWQFELKIIKTTGDKMQTMSLANPTQESTKGLFTKELEVALIHAEADLAVHSLKDLPTELPPGLILGAVSQRADVRDVLIYRDADFFSHQSVTLPADTAASSNTGTKRGLKPHATIRDFPIGTTVATSSTRRQAQLLAMRSDLRLVPIRGNVGTRLQKLIDQAELDGLVLAAAGLSRLGYTISEEGRLKGTNVPDGLLATYLSLDDMIPCVGQAALGIEIRANDARIARLCERLNHPETFSCVTAERAFLHAMGGGCLSPVAAYAEVQGDQLRLRAVSFRGSRVSRAEKRMALVDAEQLGRETAWEINSTASAGSK